MSLLLIQIMDKWFKHLLRNMQDVSGNYEQIFVQIQLTLTPKDVAILDNQDYP